jgi:hypothetical protein
MNDRPFASDRKATNVEALSQASRLAQGLSTLHLEGAQSFSAQLPPIPSARDRATLLCCVHGYNLFEAGMDLLYQGRFDVASYLYRGFRDIHGYVLAVRDDDDLGSLLLSGQLKAGAARQAVVEKLKILDPAQASEMDRSLRSEDDSYQALSHAGPVQFSKLFGMLPSGELVPAHGGIPDAQLSVSMARALLRDEQSLLLALGAAWGERLNRSWSEGVVAGGAPLNEWLAATRDV